MIGGQENRVQKAGPLAEAIDGAPARKFQTTKIAFGFTRT
jgi:hypothetical protein